MGILQTWNDIVESIGSFAGSVYKRSYWFKQINEPVLEFSCFLWSKYPKGIPFNPYARGFANSVCSQAGFDIADPPPPEFSGGQCNQVQYDVTADITRQFYENEPVDYITGIIRLYGPLSDIGIEQKPGSSESFLQFVVYGFNERGEEVRGSLSIGGVGFTATLNEVFIERTDKLPDLCGDPETEFPPDPERDPKDFVRQIIVYYYNNQGDIIGDTTLILKADINADLSIPLTVNLGGIDIDIDFDGFYFGGSDRDRNGGERTFLPPPDSIEYEEIESEEESGDEQTFEDVLVWVKIDITQKPANAKTQWGDGGPNVYYCGWFEFVIAGSYTNRVPIHWENNIFLAPEGAKGYAYTLYQGFRGKATAYTEKRLVNPELPPAEGSEISE